MQIKLYSTIYHTFSSIVTSFIFIIMISNNFSSTFITIWHNIHYFCLTSCHLNQTFTDLFINCSYRLCITENKYQEKIAHFTKIHRMANTVWSIFLFPKHGLGSFKLMKFSSCKNFQLYSIIINNDMAPRTKAGMIPQCSNSTWCIVH